jgi:hypothetical protein
VKERKMFVVKTLPEKDYSVEFFHLKKKEKHPETGVESEYYTGTECVLSSVPKGEKFSNKEVVTEEKRVKVALNVNDKFCRAMGRKAALDKLLGAAYCKVKIIKRGSTFDVITVPLTDKEVKGSLFTEVVKAYLDPKFSREIRTEFWKEYFNKSSKTKLG